MGEASVYPAVFRTLRLLWPGGLESLRHLHELEKTQWLSRTELETWQLTKLHNWRHTLFSTSLLTRTITTGGDSPSRYSEPA